MWARKGSQGTRTVLLVSSTHECSLTHITHPWACDWWTSFVWPRGRYRNSFFVVCRAESRTGSCLSPRGLTGKKAVPHRTFVFSSRTRHSFCVCRLRLASTFLALGNPRRRRRSCLRPAQRRLTLTSPWSYEPFCLLQGAQKKYQAQRETDINRECARESGGGGQPIVDWAHSRLGTPRVAREEVREEWEAR